MLLHVSFEHRGLEGEAPGIAGLRYRRRWHHLTRAFGLPPPCRAQRGRCLVQAVLALPSPVGMELLALADSGAGAEPLRRLGERLAAASRVLEQAGPSVVLGTCDHERLARDQRLADRLLSSGALVAGRLPPEAWSALSAGARPRARGTTAALALHAPSPLAALALALASGKPLPSPLEAALQLLAQGEPARALADPERFCLRWAGLDPELAELLARTEALLAAPRVGELLLHGRALALSCALSLRAGRRGGSDALALRLWREAVGPGLPAVLLPALGTALAAEAAAGRLSLAPSRQGKVYEVRTGGALLGRGATPAQARVRALDLVARALAARPGPTLTALEALPSGLDPAWRELAHRLARAGGEGNHPPLAAAARQLVVVAGAAARPGLPLDPLNRGPGRALDLEGALAVELAPWRRPSARVLDGDETVAAVLARPPAGGALEVVPSSTEARPAAIRLAQVAALVRDPTVVAPVAIEVGGRVLLCGEGTTRRYALSRFTARPRRFTPDPEAPDLGAGESARAGARSRFAGLVACRVVHDGARAAILYTTEHGEHLREVAPLAELEARLADAMRLVRAATPRAALAVRLTEGPEAAVRRAGARSGRIGLRVGGALPSLWVELAGERFGAGASLGWRDAAQALLSLWPAEGEVMLGVDAVVATSKGSPLTPILALHAASCARRRLSAHLALALRAYRSAARGRREV